VGAMLLVATLVFLVARWRPRPPAALAPPAP
jgi:hypothetical protein